MAHVLSRVRGREPQLARRIPRGALLAVAAPDAAATENTRALRTALGLSFKGRGNGMRNSRLVPAIEYLQAQRVRAMSMRQFAAAVST